MDEAKVLFPYSNSCPLHKCKWRLLYLYTYIHKITNLDDHKSHIYLHTGIHIRFSV